MRRGLSGRWPQALHELALELPWRYTRAMARLTWIATIGLLAACSSSESPSDGARRAASKPSAEPVAITTPALTVARAGSNEVEVAVGGEKKHYSCPEEHSYDESIPGQVSVDVHPDRAFLVLECVMGGRLIDARSGRSLVVSQWAFDPAGQRAAFLIGDHFSPIDLVAAESLARYIESGGKQGRRQVGAPIGEGDPARAHDILGFLSGGALRFMGACCGTADVYDVCADGELRYVQFIEDGARAGSLAGMDTPSPCAGP